MTDKTRRDGLIKHELRITEDNGAVPKNCSRIRLEEIRRGQRHTYTIHEGIINAAVIKYY